MDDSTRSFLDRFYRDNKRHDDALEDRLLRWRNIEPESAEFLGVLVRAARPRDVLEIGTSNGYAACWIADAVRDVGGAFTTIDVDPARVTMARDTLAQVGLADQARVLHAEAGEFLRTTPDAGLDLALLDAERPQYVSFWPDLDRSLRPGATLVVDNVLSHAEQVTEFLALVGRTYTCSTLSIGAGLFVAVKPLTA